MHADAGATCRLRCTDLLEFYAGAASYASKRASRILRVRLACCSRSANLLALHPQRQRRTDRYRTTRPDTVWGMHGRIRARPRHADTSELPSEHSPAFYESMSQRSVGHTNWDAGLSIGESMTCEHARWETGAPRCSRRRCAYCYDTCAAPSVRRGVFLWTCLPRMEQLRRLTLPRPAPRAVQDASQHGWLKSVPLLRLVDV